MKLNFCVLLFIIIISKCTMDFFDKTFEKCAILTNKTSSSKFITVKKLGSVLGCASMCSQTEQCDVFTYDTIDLICAVYRIREMEYINENTPLTQVYIHYTGNACPTNWHHYRQGGHCYFVSDSAKTWQEAMEYCWEEMGGYLTNVNDQSEHDYLAQLLQATINQGTTRLHVLDGNVIETGNRNWKLLWFIHNHEQGNDVFIGIKKVANEFKWASNMNIAPQSLSFANWAPFQPYENEEVVQMWKQRDFKWNDMSTVATAKFICKKPVTSC